MRDKKCPLNSYVYYIFQWRHSSWFSSAYVSMYGFLKFFIKYVLFISYYCTFK